MFFTLVTLWLVLLADFTFAIETKKFNYSMKYNGLFWLVLDYYTVMKNGGKDKLGKWFEFKKTNIN